MITKYNRRVTIDGTTYDSKFEYDLMTRTGLETRAIYHPGKIPYEVNTSHTYEPDFIVSNSSFTYYFEAKGRFNFRHDMNKYKYIRDSLLLECSPPELVFIFQNPKTPIPGAKVRKNGTKLNNGEWATKEGFRWVTLDTVDEFINKLGEDR